MQKVKNILEENFKIEKNIFIFSAATCNKAEKFVKNLIQKKLSKPLDQLNDEEIKVASDLIFNLSASEILYSIIGLLELYICDDDNLTTIIIQKILNPTVFNEYNDILNNIVDIDTGIENNDLMIKNIEAFEQKHNISILIED